MNQNDYHFELRTVKILFRNQVKFVLRILNLAPFLQNVYVHKIFYQYKHPNLNLNHIMIIQLSH